MKIKEYKNLLTLSAFLFTLLFFVIPISQAAIQLSDIQGHWAESAIQKLADQGTATGFPDGTFKPDNNISRAEFVTLTVRAFELENKNGKVFNDTSDHWAKEYIAAASTYNIISGYNDEQFGPDDSITREEMAVMAVKAAGLEINAEALNCSDSSQVSAWAKDAVATAYTKKIIVGMPDGSFLPQANATRAQAVIVLSKALQLSTEIIEITEQETPATPQESTVNSSGSSGGGGGGSSKVTVRSIEILSEPDKVIYNEGEELDLTGLIVILNKSNGTTKDVAFADFTAEGIATSPANGTVLTSTNTEVIITVNGKTVSQSITVNTASPVTVTNVSSESRAANVNWYRFTVNGIYSSLQIKTADGTALSAVTDKADFEVAGYCQGMASPDGIIVIYVDGIERYRGIPAVYSPSEVTVTNVSSESRAANVNWYRFTVTGTYSNLQIKTVDGTALGTVTDKADFETAGYYQGMASPDSIIVIYVDGIERYRGIPADYSPSAAEVTGIAIKTAPDKVTYTEGEALELAGLVVTLSKSD
ncbi:MAG: S-layer homology domain-containing protein, partial [Syntrophomonadaceae bacterium]|nr:S-layer homology domain-containing protein [Syntrophomonadaceae bacterium]